MRAENLMTTAVRTVSPSESAEAAWNLMQLAEVHHLVVMDKGKVEGILSRGDLGGPRGANRRKGRSAADLMTPSIVIASPKTTLREAANLLRGFSIGCLPVIDGKRLVGILTVTDILDAVGHGAGKATAAKFKPVYKTARWPHVGPNVELRRH